MRFLMIRGPKAPPFAVTTLPALICPKASRLAATALLALLCSCSSNPSNPSNGTNGSSALNKSLAGNASNGSNGSNASVANAPNTSNASPSANASTVFNSSNSSSASNASNASKASNASDASGASKTRFVFTGLAGEPVSLNPMLAASTDLNSLSHLYMSYLLECDDRGQLIPEIAERVPTQANGDISRDGKTFVYHLRRGVRWQDGSPLTARDVVFSYRAMMNPANNIASRVGFAEVTAISAPRDDTVVLRLRRPFSPFPAYFFGPQGDGALMPERLLGHLTTLNAAAYNQAPVSAGPFRVEKWLHGDSVTFRANPYYWRGKPRIERMTYRIIPDPNTRLQQLQTGEADAYFDIDPQLLPQLRAIPGIRIELTQVNDLHVLQFNVRDAVVGDVRLRRAIALAIDRGELIAGATHGSGVTVDADQPRNGWAYDANLAPIRYDAAAAKRLLDAAGWKVGPGGTRVKDGRPLELTLSIAPQGINGSVLVAATIQQQLHNVGIAVTIKQIPFGLFVEPATAGGLLAGGRYQMAYNAWWTVGPDPDDSWNFGCDQIPPNGYNYYFWCNRRANAAMYAALATYDRARRITDYAVVQSEILRDLPEFTLWQVRMPDAYRPRLHGFKPSPFGSQFWNAWSWTLDPVER